MQQWRIGDITVSQIVELTFDGLEDSLPDATPDQVVAGLGVRF